MSVDFPITPAVRALREKKIDFVPRLYDYVEKGGARESARQLGVDEHAVAAAEIVNAQGKTVAMSTGAAMFDPAELIS